MPTLRKRGVSLLLLSCLVISIFLLTPSIRAAPTPWSIETVDAALDVGSYSSIAIHPEDGFPRIAYHDKNWGNLKFARWTGSAWAVETVDTSAWVGEYVCLDFDSGGNPHISYFDFDNHHLKYATRSGWVWSNETVDSTAGMGMYSSLALDSSGNPHISYYNYANKDLKYAWWTGSAWAIETVDTLGDVGRYTSIALDSNDYPHISYQDYYPNYDLKYARWTGSAWAIETVDSTGDISWDTSLALDSSDNPHISYIDDTNKSLKYARWTGSTWSIEIVDPEDVGWGTSLVLDSSDNPHISYSDVYQYGLKYAKWTRSAWSFEIVDLTFIGYWVSLALDAEDRPYISYYDLMNKNLKIARTPDEYFATVNVTPLDSDSDGQNDAVMAQMDVDTTHGGTVRVTVHAFLVDPSSQYADLKSSSWNITGQVVDWMHPNASITLYVPAGYSAGPANYMLMLTLFDADGFLEDSYQQVNIFLHPSSTPPPTPMIESCNSTGERKDSFDLGEIVFVNGSGFSPSTTYSLYIVMDQATWTDGMIIPERVPDTEPGVSSNADGTVSPTDVWHNPQTAGNYDIIVDINGNGQYDAGVDALDDGDVEITAGVSVIPEFSTILPVFFLATSLVAILLKKKIRP